MYNMCTLHCNPKKTCLHICKPLLKIKENKSQYNSILYGMHTFHSSTKYFLKRFGF